MVPATSVTMRCRSAIQFPEFLGDRSFTVSVVASAVHGAFAEDGSVDGAGGTDEAVAGSTEDDVVPAESRPADPQPAITSSPRSRLKRTCSKPSASIAA